MSRVLTEIIACPACGVEGRQAVLYSLNPVRSPRLEQAILDRTLCRATCAACAGVFVVENPFLYVDFEARRWVATYPQAERVRWEFWEHDPLRSIDDAVGELAPAIAQSFGRDMIIRTVFGLESLREKVVVWRAGLDDRAIEALKLLALMQGGLGGVEAGDPIRVEAVDARTITLRTHGSREAAFAIDRAEYDRIVGQREAWAAFFHEVEAGPWVDLARLYATDRVDIFA